MTDILIGFGLLIIPAIFVMIWEDYQLDKRKTREALNNQIYEKIQSYLKSRPNINHVGYCFSRKEIHKVKEIVIYKYKNEEEFLQQFSHNSLTFDFEQRFYENLKLENVSVTKRVSLDGYSIPEFN